MIARKVVSGFVIKLETQETDPTTHTTVKKRVEVSRVYHSREAAETLLAMMKKAYPNRDYYLSEKNKRDDNAPIT